MISDRRPRWRGPRWAVCLLLALVAALSAAPVSANAMTGRAPDLASTATVPTRVEGFLRLSDGKWFVDATRVLIGPETGVDERRGAMAPGAWVSVWGDMTAETLTARVLHVLRPAGSEAPPLQFVGVLTKFVPGIRIAVVSGAEVHFDNATLIPVTPPLYSQVRVTGHRQGLGVFALSIEVIATSVGSVPVYIEGVIEQVTGATIVVDGHTVLLQQQAVGRFQQGDWVQVRALAAGDGTLVADRVEVVDRSREAAINGYVASISGLGEDSQTWEVVTFEGGRAQTRRVLVANETYVGEDRASMQPETEAFIDGSKLNAVDVKAEMIWLDQPALTQQAGKLTQGMADGLWSLDGRPVYLPSNEVAGQARAARAESTEGDGAVVVSGLRLSNGVLIAKDVRPATAADLARPQTRVDRMAGAAGIAWDGPTSVVTPVNASAAPTLLFSAGRTAHLVYDSDGSIYYVTRQDGKAWSAPRRLARGVSPTAVFDARGTLHVAYVNTFAGNSEIFHIMLKPGGQWTLPTPVSSTTGSSNAPALAADAKGELYVAWADHTSGAWMVHSGQYDGGFWTNYPVPNARGASPSMAVLSNGNLFLAWHDRVPSATDAFGALNIYGAEKTAADWYLPVNISDNARYSPGAESRAPSLVAAADGNAHLAWVDNNQQPRYDFGHGLYWPPPVNLGPRQTYANGLSLKLGAQNVLYATWDDKTAPLLTAAPIGAQTWPAGEQLPGVRGDTYGASLALANGGMAVAWLQDGGQNVKTIFEARSGLAPVMLKSLMPVIIR